MEDLGFELSGGLYGLLSSGWRAFFLQPSLCEFIACRNGEARWKVKSMVLFSTKYMPDMA